MAMNRETKYQVVLIAYKDIGDHVKNLITKKSVCNIKNRDLLMRQSNYQGSGRDFNLNDRISIYLGWFKDQICEKLEEGYTLDIIEVHKSYGRTRSEILEALNIEYGENILILDAQDL